MSAVTETSNEITEDQANEALRQLLADKQQAEKEQPVAEAAPVEAPEPPAEEPPAEPEPDEAEPEAVEAAAPPPSDDDVASLRQRLAEREKQVAEAEQRYQSRLAAIQSRNQESERIQREKYLRKSTAADRALKTLRAVRSESGAPEAEVDRVIQEVESTMNPQSASYAPPPTPQAESAEDQAIVVNRFLNEKLMDAGEADEFGKWLKTDAGTEMNSAEQELHRRDLDGFLRIAHVRYQESLKQKANKRTEAVEAAKVVQRTQKLAARAASATPTAPRKPAPSGAPPNMIPFDKITPEDVSKWVRQSLDQYK